MCASYESRFSFTQLKIDFTLGERQLPLNLEQMAEVRPTMIAPFVFWRDGAPALAKGRFGLWQPWMQGKRISSFNARCETVATSRLYSPLLRAQRALIPCEAFHEWTGERGAKRRWRFTVKDGDQTEKMFALAGLWCRAIKEGEEVLSFTILVGDANGTVAPYHDRMPVIVPRGDWSAWLDPVSDPFAFIRPFPAEKMAVEEIPLKMAG